MLAIACHLACEFPLPPPERRRGARPGPHPSRLAPICESGAAPNILAGAYRDRLMSGAPFFATLARDEAVLRFPYDEDLRPMPRAIPGRRWYPLERAWCVPVDPDQAEALARLLAGLPG